MFTKTKITLAAALVASAASVALAGDQFEHEDKWYPQTPQEIQQARQAASASGAFAFVLSTQKRASARVKSQPGN